ncbi:MAG: T9SS type A sorting domain-containing protein [Chitinophagaceae bacterium]|nr:T9SS type A sorting domain-containing protein [Chitinophagaceae bacterium]
MKTIQSRSVSWKGTKLSALFLFVFFTCLHDAGAQCTNTVIDWDYREFFAQNNATIRTYVSLAQSQSQVFALGANKLTITHNYTTSSSIAGENNTHTGSAGSYGSGADVEFTGNGTVTFTFHSSVTDVKFSLYDIDRNQRVQFGATDGATARNIILSKVSGSIISFTNNGTTTARADAVNTTVANSSTDGTVNVYIAGPVTQVTMTISNTGTCSFSCGGGGTETGQFWISDIAACSAGSFPNNYYAASQPFTGMPSYVLAVMTDSVYYLDPLTGKAKFLFADIGPGNLNSMAYDPYNRYIYYTYSLTGSGGTVNQNEKALRRYDCNMDTFGVVVPNINTMGIPTFEQGVESGAAAFYNGNLYLGVEGGSSSTESIIYRVEMNASSYPVAFSQVYGQAAQSGSTRLHDWSDFGLNNGTLYDFDAGVAASGVNKDFFTQDLLTGVVTNYAPVGTLVPRQVSIDWTGQLYNVGSPAATAKGTIAPYNGTDNVNYALEDTITLNGVKVIGSWGDGAEAFRPFCDFGDAPASYDPDLLSPAVNERDVNLRLGASLDVELSKTASGLANADGADEDGIATVTILATAWSTYHVEVSVYNNTGSNATLIGWLDYNGNGVFESGEASAIETVASAGAQQNVYLSWTGISSSLAAGTYTYLRVRLASATPGMTAANATGWFDNGETEDYRVPVQNTVLPVNLISFTAKVIGNSKVKLSWSANEEMNFRGYEIECSSNKTNWENLVFIQPGRGNTTQKDYEFIDNDPYKEITYYRLKVQEANGSSCYSKVREVKITSGTLLITLAPNPATDHTAIMIDNANGQTVYISITDVKGNKVFYRKVLISGEHYLADIPVQVWLPGTYFVSVKTNHISVNKKLAVQR